MHSQSKPTPNLPEVCKDLADFCLKRSFETAKKDEWAKSLAFSKVAIAILEYSEELKRDT